MLSKQQLTDLGKAAEDQVAKRLKVLENLHCYHYRLPDAKAGSRKVALADFLVMCRGICTLLEVKEVSHAYRLPSGNFDTGQIARMRRHALAGGQSLVAVFFKPVQLWAVTDISYFLSEQPVASWDMRDRLSINVTIDQINHDRLSGNQ